MSVTEPLQQFAAVFFEPFFLRAIGWKNTKDFGIEFLRVVHLPAVTKFMNNNAVQNLRRGKH